jgi:phospho-N-acetylmuramoyl-pentapeptide-transferase
MSPLWSLGLGFVLAFGLGPLAIRLLRALHFGQTVREVGPQSHLKKTGTPTMGGLLFLVAATLAAVAFGPRDNLMWAALAFTWGNGLIGFADDFIKVRLHRPLGVRARTKLGLGALLGLVFGLLALGPLKLGTDVLVPFTHLVWQPEPVLFVVLVLLTGLATTNAVNLTDGLDGLAGGLGLIVAMLFSAFAVADGVFSLATFSLALAGALGGYLYYNLHPARVIMGDVGSFALGGALAAVAVLLRLELVLVVAGFVFAIETLSVAVQVFWFRRTGRRLLRMSPLHHHMELGGMAETAVVYRFWILGLICAVLAYVAFWA